ncbi:hypothetical protein B7494_g3723 [Chlorociboria aeruginascens]|nr:hypothetical protein B7494_g3723 [Chlorociboria aeruginascens]
MATDNSPKPKSLLGYHRILSPAASIKVSPICLGSMNFGEAWKDLMGECTKETAFSILSYFHASGGNFIDTANLYMAGESEIWLGEWMALCNTRDEMIIATKYTWPVKTLAGDPNSIVSNHSESSNIILSNYGGNNKKNLRLSLDTSLKNLQTDYVDILYVHAWEGTSIPELMNSLNDVVRSGKVLYLGVSNWPAWVVVKANAYARQHGLAPFVVYEGHWNPADREIEREILPMCRDEGMGITVWGALGGGKFKNKAREDDRGRTFTDDLGFASVETLQKIGVVMEKVGKKRGTDAMGIALRYVMLKVSCAFKLFELTLNIKAPYVFPIVGGRTVDHLRRNIEALKIDLSEEDIQTIESVVPFDFGYPHSLISGNRYKPISGLDPAKFIRLCSFFDGVEEPKPIRSRRE